MGAVRIIGAAVFVAGIVYFAIGLLITADSYFGILGDLSFGATGAADVMVSILGFGLFYGPVLIGVGLVLLYASARMREKAAISS